MQYYYYLFTFITIFNMFSHLFLLYRDYFKPLFVIYFKPLFVIYLKPLFFIYFKTIFFIYFMVCFVFIFLSFITCHLLLYFWSLLLFQNVDLCPLQVQVYYYLVFLFLLIIKPKYQPSLILFKQIKHSWAIVDIYGLKLVYLFVSFFYYCISLKESKSLILHYYLL
jgi:hypothetical protein